MTGQREAKRGKGIPEELARNAKNQSLTARGGKVHVVKRRDMRWHLPSAQVPVARMIKPQSERLEINQ